MTCNMDIRKPLRLAVARELRSVAMNDLLALLKILEGRSSSIIGQKAENRFLCIFYGFLYSRK